MKRSVLVVSVALGLVALSACKNRVTGPTPYNPGIENPNPIPEATVPTAFKTFKDDAGNELVMSARITYLSAPPNSIVLGLDPAVNGIFPPFDCDARPVCFEYKVEYCIKDNPTKGASEIGIYLGEHEGEAKWLKSAWGGAIGSVNSPPVFLATLVGCAVIDRTRAGMDGGFMGYPYSQPRFLVIKSMQYDRRTSEKVWGIVNFPLGYFNPCTDPEFVRTSGRCHR